MLKEPRKTAPRCKSKTGNIYSDKKDKVTKTKQKEKKMNSQNRNNDTEKQPKDEFLRGETGRQGAVNAKCCRKKTDNYILY